MPEYAIQATLFIGARDEKTANAVAELIAERVNQPYNYDLHDEDDEPEPIDVQLRLE